MGVSAACIYGGLANIYQCVKAPPGPADYTRMFPELPSFEADEQFLLALGLACRDIFVVLHSAKLTFVPKVVVGTHHDKEK